MRAQTLGFVAAASLVNAQPQIGGAEGHLPGAGEVRLYYRVLGSGRPVVVLHGGPGGSSRDLLQDLQPLSADHRLIFFDQRGGGRSTLPEDKSLLDAKYFVEDLDAVRRFFGLDRLTLLAHSFGSVLAGRYIETFPDRVERVVFIGAMGPRATDAYAFAREQSQRMPADKRALAAGIVGRLQGDGEVDRVRLCHEYEELQRATLPTDAPRPRDTSCDESKEAVEYSMRFTSRLTFESFGSWNFIPSMRRVTAPLLVIHGDRDPSPLSSQEAWVTAVPNGRLLTVRGAGHSPHVDRSTETLSAVRTFLSGGWPKEAVRPAR